MARQITREHAQKIARKLKAKKRKNSKNHDYYDVYDGDTIATYFTIRRGSEKDQGHDHIPKQLRINTHQTKCLAQCTYTRDDYLGDIRER